MQKILLVDDEAKMRELLALYLKKEGYTILEAADGLKAVEMVDTEKPDLVILDIMLPGMDGLEVCKKIRLNSLIPIMMLTAKGEEIDKVLGLELGADDYLVKPFSPRELVARVKALLRRSNPVAIEANNFSVADVEIDIAERKVLVSGSEIILTPKEFEMLLYLMQHKQQVLSRERILEKVWGYDFFGDLRTVDTHVKNLREKLGSDHATYIKTVWGVGYKFEVKL